MSNRLHHQRSAARIASTVLCAVVFTFSGCDSETAHIESGELKPLFIGQSQLEEWSGEEALAAAERAQADELQRFPFALATPFLAIGALLLLIGGIGKMQKLAITGLVFLIVAGGGAYYKSSSMLAADKKASESLLPLLKDVQEFNQLVNNIDVLNQLRSAGNDVKLEDRDTVMAALAKTRNRLGAALKTERILRENPSFNPLQLKEQVGFQVATATEQELKATEYAEIFSSAVDMDRRIQAKFEELVKEGD